MVGRFTDIIVSLRRGAPGPRGTSTCQHGENWIAPVVLAHLHRVIRGMTDTPHLGRTLGVLIASVYLTVSARIYSICLTSRSQHYCCLVTAQKLGGPHNHAMALTFSRKVINLINELTRPVGLTSTRGRPDFGCVPSMGRRHFHTFLNMPVVRHHRLLNMLIMRRQRLHRCSRDRRSFLIALTARVTTVLSRSRLATLFKRCHRAQVHTLPTTPNITVTRN